MLKKLIKTVGVVTAMAAMTSPTAAQMGNAYYFVIAGPTSEKQANNENISISIASATLPTAKLETPYVGFDFNSLVSIYGDPDLDLAQVSWTITEGNLPAGLTLSKNGILEGTASQAQTEKITLQAKYKGHVTEASFELQSAPLLLTFSPPSRLRQGTAGLAYSYNFKNSLKIDGKASMPGDVKWSLSGQHSGLNITQDGLLTGYTLEGNAFGVNKKMEVTVQTPYDEIKRTVSLEFFSIQKMPQGTAGLHYTYDLKNLAHFKDIKANVIGWRLAEGTLHQGLELSADGIVSGFSLEGNNFGVRRVLTFEATTNTGEVVKRTVSLEFYK